MPDGALLIDERGRISVVGPDSQVPRPEGVPQDSYPTAALVPGLVNTHTHLELTGLDSAVDRTDFAAWIRMVRALKARRGAPEFLAAARRGIAECRAAGVTTVADTGDSGAVIEALAEAGASGVAYIEVFGPHPDQADESLADLARRVADLGRFASGRVRIGVSPHAPYSVSGSLFSRVAGWAGSEGLPLAVHVAESEAECTLLSDGHGPFADMWRTRGIAVPEPLGSTPIEWLRRHGVLGPDTLCIHVVQASVQDIETLADSDSAVAHCPISNRAHGHGDAPLRALLASGIRVGCGTDSVLSIGRLDLLADVRAARRLGGLSAAQALRLGTLDAARAIGMSDEVGSIAPGKWGDVAVIDVQGADTLGDSLEAIIASGPATVLATYQGGRLVHSRVESLLS